MPDPHAGDVTVVGAGLIGLFSAHYLLERGYDVTLLERGTAGGGAARVNGGWVCPARSDPLPSWGVVRDGVRSLARPYGGSFFLGARALPHVAGYLGRFVLSSGAHRFERSWDELDVLNRQTAGLIDELVEAGIVSGLQDEGFLMVHPTREQAEASWASLSAVSRRGLSPAPEPVVGRGELLELEPGLGEAARFGFVHRGDRWLDPSRLVDRLVGSAISRGARVVTETPVRAVRQRGSRVELATPAGVIEAGHVVIAAGAWSEELLRPIGVRGYVTPGKGYSFTVHPERPPRHVLRLGDTHVGVTPMGDRTRVLGLVELDGTHEGVHTERIALMKRQAAPYLTGIDWDASTDEAVGARPMTPDGKPLIGCVPGAERIVVATGHNMLGLSLGAATGVLVAAFVAKGPAAAVPAFDPMRFTRRHGLGSARARAHD
ncbi:MAG: FAD-binding oxidoreductase [Intrasporangium sp.]|uniref:NAD(P)/FAD-dependent oxidoreductase n=1 Tax=Intrasporangium sp. TaxID=1925024 RepID=UPI0026483184|nr:FAD-binding oxidoreductase [Intrasporangium sp.]MDN5798237.1 FAD-binding oxidoreductase [Intrasporangium sp.]